jgi:hypothetical protein
LFDQPLCTFNHPTMAFFYQPVIFGPGWLSRPRSKEEDNDECVVSLLAMACAGTPGLLALSGAIVGFLCVAAAQELHRQYQIYTRKGYYGHERRCEEARRGFEAELAAWKDSPNRDFRRHQQIFSAYYDELRRIDRDFERETGLTPWEAIQVRGPVRKRKRADSWRDDNEHGRGGWSPWASPKAVQSRKRRRAKRLALWREWGQKCAEAVRLGKTPPPSPAERRIGGGVPIRRLCERSSSLPPTPEALLAQYDKAKGRGSVEEKLRLGSMMLDIEAAVDSSLVRDPSGEIVGRNAGIRGWIAENCPSLLSHYASLMGYRRLADEFRKVHGLRDPHPATRFLEPEFPAACFAPAVREPMRSRYVAARRLLASPAAKTAKGFAEALARTRRAGIAPRRRTG